MAGDRRTFPALGTTAVVAVATPPSLEQAERRVREVIAAFDLACSRFRPDSELLALSRSAGTPVRVSRTLFDAIGAALRAAALTDGDVDPTLGSALCALGYDRDFDELAARGPAQARTVRVPGWRVVRLDERTGSVSVPPGVALDLGATAKALCADRAARAAHEATGAGVLVALGGDIAIAGEAVPGGWPVRVTDDHRAGAGAPGQSISLATGGLATSSTQVRRWSTDAGPAHHLLDPRTGRPVDGPWRTVSVCAGTCLDANIASTAAIVRGAGAPEWLERRGLPSRLVSRAGEVLHLAGWPSGGEELTALARPLAATAP